MSEAEETRKWEVVRRGKGMFSLSSLKEGECVRSDKKRVGWEVVRQARGAALAPSPRKQIIQELIDELIQPGFTLHDNEFDITYFAIGEWLRKHRDRESSGAVQSPEAPRPKCPNCGCIFRHDNLCVGCGAVRPAEESTAPATPPCDCNGCRINRGAFPFLNGKPNCDKWKRGPASRPEGEQEGK